jgi:hypothetical protein
MNARIICNDKMGVGSHFAIKGYDGKVEMCSRSLAAGSALTFENFILLCLCAFVGNGAMTCFMQYIFPRRL